MSRQIIVSEHMSMVALLALAVLTLAGCGGGSSGGSVSPAPVSVPRSMTHPPVTLDPIQPRWFQIIYAPTLASAKPMLLNVQGASLLGGTQLILYPQQANALNEAWQFTQVGSSGSTSYGYFTRDRKSVV